MRTSRRAGFTSVELVVAVVAAAVLAITAGTLIFLAHRGWRDNLATVDLQRDATFALDLISHELRPAARTRVTVTTGRIEIEGISTATGTTTQAIYLLGDDLLQDPSITVNGDEMVLVRDRVAAFTPSLSGPGVAVSLLLTNQDKQVTMNTLTRWRN